MNRNKSIRVAILCLSLAMAGSLPIDAQKVTFHEGSIETGILETRVKLCL